MLFRAPKRMRTPFILLLSCVLSCIQTKPSSVSCPSGQFAFKNRCVLCHPTCTECEGHELFQCTACGMDEDGRERFLYQGHCRAHCPLEFYADQDQYTCVNCIVNCDICVDGLICAKCKEGYQVQNGLCLAIPCGVGQVLDPDSGECIDCETGCKTCSADDPEYCTSCTDGYFLYKHQCRQHCPQRNYKDLSSGMCLSCPESCLDCRSKLVCLTCQPGHFLHNGVCVTECPQGTFGDAMGWHCQSCHSSCLTCHGPGARDCDKCSGWSSPIYGRCPASSCPEGQYFDSEVRNCRYCDVSCRTCYGPKAQTCYTCATGYMLEQQEAICVQHCPLGFYANNSSQQCERCSAYCEVCESEEQCVSCNSDTYQLFLFQGSCWSECPDGYFETEERTCEPCDNLCLTCDGSKTQCLSCREGLFLENGLCRSNCSERSYAADDGTCRRCGPHCETCIESNTCTRCSFLYLLLDGMCKASCPGGYFEDLDQGLCVQCHVSCATCSGPLADDCESCSAFAPKLYEGACSEECPAGTYYQITNMECQECHQTCAACVGPEPTQCSRCMKGLALDPNTMMCGVTGDSDCPPKTFLHENQFTCQACHRHCQSCEGPGPADCQTCALPRYLHNRSCVTECPAGKYSAHEEADGVELGFCMPCDHVCATCSGASPKDCLSCSSGYLLLLSHLCVTHCPTGYYSTGKHCEKCDRSCKLCSGPGPEACMCVPPLLEIQGTRVCVEHCPHRFYQSSRTCQQCHTSCKTCTDGTAQACITCDGGSILQDGVCYPHCEEGHYYSQSEVCELCDESCKHCSGAGPENCVTCQTGFGLHVGTRRCMSCCQPDETTVNCCLCHSSSALCTEGPLPANNQTNEDELNLRSQTSHHTSAALPTILVLAVVALSIFVLAHARARKRLCWRQRYQRLRGLAGARPDPCPMPHGVPEPEDSGDDADVVYTSRDGSIYRRYKFIHEPDPVDEEENEEDETNENTHLKGGY